MSTNIQETIDRLRELGQKARPAPWSYLILPVDIDTNAQDSVLLDGDGHGFATNAEDAFTRNDFDFMLEARNAIPVLLTEIERLSTNLSIANARLGRVASSHPDAYLDSL